MSQKVKKKGQKMKTKGKKDLKIVDFVENLQKNNEKWENGKKKIPQN